MGELLENSYLEDHLGNLIEAIRHSVEHDKIKGVT